MNTTLLIMAAGIGSRFGTGIKQLEPVDDANHIIMDYSIHDAIEAGFNHVVFIIRKDIEKEFKEVIGERIASICSAHNVTVDYAFQDINDIPDRLFKINSNIEFVAIQNMTREQVYDTLKSAKVYIDFGYFPGPERMPREAVALYCNIITSTEGSAENDVDVPVPKEFKFNTRDKKNISLVADLINKMIVNYYDYVKCGDAYRQKVWNQIDSFSDQINKIFEEDFDI